MAICGTCGREYDPEDIYDGSWSRFMVDGEWIEINFLEFYPDAANQTLCEDCAFRDWYENYNSGLDYEFSLETGMDPVNRRLYA